MNKIIHIFNKDSFFIPLIAILLGFLLGALIMLIGGYNPWIAYLSLFNKVFGDLYNIGETIREITPLILTGLSVAFAFRTGLFNIGAAGQMMIGMTGATFIGVKLSLPWFLHVPLALLVGGVLGGLWGSIAGYLKAKRGINEVITTIMLNWIALYLSNYIIANFLFDPKNKQRSLYIQDSASLSMNFLSDLFHHARMNWGIILALIGAFLFYIILWKTKRGYELRAVGFNPHGAEYAGMNVSRNLIISMFISGIFAGVAGVIQILGVYHYQTVTAALPSQGFDAIAVALLGGNTPVGVILASTLFGSLNYGAAGMKFGAEVPPEIIRVVISSIIFFVAAHGLIRFFLKPLMKGEKN